MVTGFVLDSMHTIDIGVFRRMMSWLFEHYPTKRDGKKLKVYLLTRSKLDDVDGYWTKVMSQSWIKDTARKPRFLYFSIEYMFFLLQF